MLLIIFICPGITSYVQATKTLAAWLFFGLDTPI